MSGPREEVRYLVFDIESVADAGLIAQIRHQGEDIDPADALAQYRNELLETKGTDFVPYTFQVPISLALAKVAEDYSLRDLKCLKVEEGGPAAICEKFWNGWMYYQKPTFITFNGRGFDIPLMELTAFRYGIPIAEWLAWGGKQFDQPRYRFSQNSHLDLCEYMSNFGSVQITGGLNLLSKILHKPGKMDTKGEMVQDMYDAGQLATIHDYCKCDVLDTYFVFLRTMLLTGRISAIQEKDLIESTRNWLKERVEKEPVFAHYLKVWEERETSPQLVFSVPSKVEHGAVAPSPVSVISPAEAAPQGQDMHTANIDNGTNSDNAANSDNGTNSDNAADSDNKQMESEDVPSASSYEE
ncbi:MAG: 3'-5' exonuclease [Thermoguttaceae bacterium]|nr:3'-5' exonuclease [Thermoguttaceae bacterium]